MTDKSLGFLAEAITDLSKRVERLTAEYEHLAGHSTPPGAVGERVAALEAAVVELKVARKGARGKAKHQKDIHTPWHRLSIEQAEERWWQLYEWVRWLVDRNDIGPKDIPRCWYRHGGYVDELEALRWAWLESYGPDAKGTDPVWWREVLSRARMRFPAFNANGCNVTHSEGNPRRGEEDRQWRDFLAEDLAARAIPQRQEAS